MLEQCLNFRRRERAVEYAHLVDHSLERRVAPALIVLGDPAAFAADAAQSGRDRAARFRAGHAPLPNAVDPQLDLRALAVDDKVVPLTVVEHVGPDERVTLEVHVLVIAD